MTSTTRRKPLGKRDTDLVRLIGQHLRGLGLVHSVDALVEESGCSLENLATTKFRMCVVAGNWKQADKALEEVSSLLVDPTSIWNLKLLLLEEKYLEHLENRRDLEALHCLRQEIASLPIHEYEKKRKIHHLASLLMCQNPDELRKTAKWAGVKSGSRERLMDNICGFFPANIMLPPKRLTRLLQQATELQIERCNFHCVSSSVDTYPLLTDHICTRDDFPASSVHTLADHSDEVWYLQFSHNGKLLASGCKDGEVIVWDITGQPKKHCSIKTSYTSGITYIAWSPDDSLFIVCGSDDSSEAIVYITESGEEKCRVHQTSEDCPTCCAWHNDGTKFYVAGTRGQFFECSSRDGSILGQYEGVRLRCIAVQACTNNVLAADTHCRIRSYNFQEHTSNLIIQEDHPIMSFTLSKCGHYALLNIANQGIHMWDLMGLPLPCLVRRFSGVTQGFCTIHSCFGGLNENFVVSGSEDNNVYVWHKKREYPIAILDSHTRTVNCVSWNPVRHSMIASASDDTTIKIWGTKLEAEQQQRYLEEKEAKAIAEDKKSQSREQEGTSTSPSSDQETISERRPEGNDSSSQALGGSSSQEMSMESIEEEGTGQNSSSATSEGSGESFITSSSGAQLPQEMVRSASQESTEDDSIAL
ncbi:WD repeat-containing protein 26-like isoform X2 [Dysidea avara]